MSLNDEYYEFVLKDKQVSKEKEIVFNIVKDFTDRRGLRQEWEQIDDDIKEEIIESWIDKTKQSLNV